MNLENHFALVVFTLHFIMNVYHGNFYDIRCGTLNWHVNCYPLFCLHNIPIGSIQIARFPAAFIQCLHIASVSCQGYCFIHIFSDSGIGSKIIVNENFGICHGNSQFLTHAVGTCTIHNAKINHLGRSPLIRGYFSFSNTIYQCCRSTMNIRIFFKSFDQFRLL